MKNTAELDSFKEIVVKILHAHDFQPINEIAPTGSMYEYRIDTDHDDSSILLSFNMKRIDLGGGHGGLVHHDFTISAMESDCGFHYSIKIEHRRIHEVRGKPRLRFSREAVSWDLSTDLPVHLGEAIKCWLSIYGGYDGVGPHFVHPDLGS